MLKPAILLVGLEHWSIEDITFSPHFPTAVISPQIKQAMAQTILRTDVNNKKRIAASCHTILHQIPASTPSGKCSES